MSSFLIEATFLYGGTPLSGAHITGSLQLGTISGTAAIVGGSANVAGFAYPFTFWQFNNIAGSEWNVTFIDQNQTYTDPQGVDYLGLAIVNDPGPYFDGFLQAKIVDGGLSNVHFNTVLGIGSETILGMEAFGAVCPATGCVAFPPPAGVPGPIAGEGFLPLVIGVGFLLATFRRSLR